MLSRAAAFLLLPTLVLSQATPGEWPMFNRDLAATRYSPLTQINTSNVARLKKVWSIKLGKDRGAGGITGGSEFTPIMVKGVLYAATSQEVVALEPDTGRELWRYKPSTNPSRRGVAFWPGDKNNPARIVFTAGPKMIGLNAATGKPLPASKPTMPNTSARSLLPIGP